MTSNELRKKFLDFFKESGHTIVPSSSLLPAEPSVLFTTAGMQQFKEYYLNKESPYGNKVSSCQKCFRTSDIEEVGDERHLTFFEMLGNFSFGGYFKKESIGFAKKFLDSIGAKIDYVTVFQGDKDVPQDQESAEIWQELGFSEKKGDLRFCSRQENFWGPTGDEGPCGPTTEIYSQGIEIWNLVFNEFFQTKEKKLNPLKRKGIDTGMGLERLAVVMQRKKDIFETDLFWPIINEIEKQSGLRYQKNKRSFRILTDHAKAAVFLASEGVLPSNVERGYILRRVLRRAIRFGRTLNLPRNFLTPLVGEVIEIYADVYPEVKTKKDFIARQLAEEKEKFEKTLEAGLKELERIPQLTGDIAFDLYQSYGLPLEVAEEIKPVKDKERFFKRIKEHQKLSRTASAGMFKSGLADHSEQVVKYHTATHLLLAALKRVLGDANISQKGSNITGERTRFDFSFPRKLSKEELEKVENLVNQKIEEDLAVKCREMPLEKAKKEGASGVFGERYAEVVKVFTIFNEKTGEVFSKEICAGPHVKRTSELSVFKITREESSGAGVRRIKAVLK